MEEEVWIPIKGYESKYLISNLGRVKSIQFNKHFIKKQRIGNHGYQIISVTIKNKNNVIKKCLLVHRLIAEAFIPNPLNKKEVNHINGIKTDYRIDNLEWVTPSENQTHSYRILNNKSCQIAAQKAKEKLSKKIGKYDYNMNLLEIYDSITDAAKKLNKSHSHISQCCNDIRKTAYGFKWKFI